MSESLHRQINESTDPLTDALIHFPLHAHVYASPRVCGAWRINPTGHHQAGFHLVSEGQCWLHQDGFEPRALHAGDLVFVAHDCWHVLSPDQCIKDDRTVLTFEENGEPFEVICGSVEFPGGMGRSLIAGLPAMVVIPGADMVGQDNVRALGRLMANESQGTNRGARIIQDRLADVLLTLALRHLMNTGAARKGLLAGLADPFLGKALMYIHRDFEEPWNLSSLSAAVGLSRSAFARKFQDLMEETPMNYLTEWRMLHAEKWLREGHHSVAQIAERLGYETDAAFRKTFKRIRGQTPGEVRRQVKGAAHIQSAFPPV